MSREFEFDTELPVTVIGTPNEHNRVEVRVLMDREDVTKRLPAETIAGLRHAAEINQPRNRARERIARGAFG